MQFALGPQWHCLAKGLKAFRDKGEIRLQQALELHPWLFVKNHVIEVSRTDLAFSEAVINRTTRKAVIALLTGKTLLLNRCNDGAVLDQSRCGVVIKCGYAKDACSHGMYPIEQT